MKSTLSRGVESKTWNFIMIVTTLWSIFASDIYFAALGPPAGDSVIYGISLMCFLLFTFEWVVRSWVEPGSFASPILAVTPAGYWLSFFFFLDAVAIVSLLPEVLHVWGLIIFSEGGQLSFARAGRAARAATRCRPCGCGHK